MKLVMEAEDVARVLCEYASVQLGGKWELDTYSSVYAVNLERAPRTTAAELPPDDNG